MSGLNAAAIKNKYPLSHIDELFDCLKGAKVISKIDLQGCYNQIPVREDRKRILKWLYLQWCMSIVTLELCCSGWLMHLPISWKPWKTCFIIWANLWWYSLMTCWFSQTLRKSMSKILGWYSKHCVIACFMLNWKGVSCLSRVGFLGHVINEGTSVDLNKASTVMEWQRSSNVKEVRSFLGMARYYRRFVKIFSIIANPLSKLTHNNVKVQTDE